jgi:hypothetical protein
VDSSTVAERLPAMCGRLTLTTEVSSTSIIALDMTAIATNQRFAEEWVTATLLI